MAKIIIGKLESVKRQTDVAIRLFAENDDPIAVHVLASSAFRILRDLAEKDDNNFAREKFKTSINPEKENEFWAAFNKCYNFFKHSDRDPTESICFEEKVNDYLLFFVCLCWTSLKQNLTKNMICYSSWFIQRHPEMIPDNHILAPFIHNFNKYDISFISRNEDLQLLNIRLKSNY